MVEALRRFTYRRQLLGCAGADPAGVLQAVVGVYSAHPTAPLSLHARCAHLDRTSFAAVPGLRLPAMRGSIHLLPADTAHLAFAAVPEPPARSARRLQMFDLTPALYAERAALVEAAAHAPRTTQELQVETGIPDLTGVVAQMTRDGRLVRVAAGGLRSNALRYRAQTVASADAGAALAWLANGYLRAFGPIRVADFAWWAGVSLARARAALEQHETRALDGGLLLPAELEPEFERAGPIADAVDLLPRWDCYTMGYPGDGRDRLADPAVAARCYDHRGDGIGIVLVNGAASGLWWVRGGAQLTLDVELFEPAGSRLQRALDARLDAVRRLLA